MADDLNAPLGLDREREGRFKRPVRWLRIAFAGLALVAASLVAFIIITGDRRGGEPFAIAKIELEPRPPTPAVVPKAGATEDATGAITPSGATSAADLERSSGVKVLRPGGAAAPGALVIRLPDPAGLHLSEAPDPRLVEEGRYGPLPRVAADGARALEIYARPVVTSPKLSSVAPRVAILVGGMGLSRAATQDAIDKLPGAVTLAFAPYGAELEGQVARARESGHEVLLQLPMESFDAGEGDPGPHTLRTNRSPEAIVDDLHWLMSRFSGYAGVTNFLGGRFTGDEAALASVLRDVKDRGLLYVDDASSPRSIADGLAVRSGLAFARADIVIDAAKSADAIDAALTRLETTARQKGLAVGSASGLPIGIERIARFARTLEDRGIALVPVSAAASVASRPTAEAKER